MRDSKFLIESEKLYDFLITFLNYNFCEKPLAYQVLLACSFNWSFSNVMEGRIWLFCGQLLALRLLVPYIKLFILQVDKFAKSFFNGWLVGWVLWHMNLCRLFNAKSIFMKIVLFQAIQFSLSMQFKLWVQFNCEKHFYFKLISLVNQV